jgi:hypothetical protein
LAKDHVLTPPEHKKARCRTAVAEGEDYRHRSLIVKGLKKCCICDQIDGIEDEKKAGNVGREHKSMSSDDGNCEDTEAEIDSSNGKQSITGKAQ